MNQRDVIVGGAGLAGSAAAIVLSRRGLSVTVVDPWAEFPHLFRAEKIESDQADLLRRLDLMDGVLTRTRTIREIVRAKGGRVRFRRQVEQYGISYQDIVNAVRAQLPSSVEFKVGRVESVMADRECPRIVLRDGTQYQGRLVVLATGMSGDLYEQLAIPKRMVKEELSMAFGFVLMRPDGGTFPFDAVTYRPSSTSEHVGYLTLFGMGNVLRGNLFAYWPVRAPETREFVRDPKAVLSRVLPGLDEVIGDYVVNGRVEPYRIDLYRAEDCARPGIVLLGDAYQSVCPSTGLGLSKVLTDVDTLCNACVPSWFQTPEIGAEKLALFYGNAQKRLVDDRALRRALRGRMLALDTSLPWRLRRTWMQWRWAHGG